MGGDPPAPGVARHGGSQMSKQPHSGRPSARRRSGVLTPAVLIIAAGLFALAALVYGVILDASRSARAARPIEGVEEFADLPRGHVEGPLAHEGKPPPGGEHGSAWQNCGVYTTPIPIENALHSLEHGAVWITYSPDLPSEQVRILETLTRKSDYRLLSPYPGLTSPIVASAWGYQLSLEKADDPRLLDFFLKYEQNPAGPEPGAPCSGGVGEPE